MLNKELKEYGFPDIIIENTYFWNEWFDCSRPLNSFGKSLYALVDLYNKTYNENLLVSKTGDTISINNNNVFHLSSSRRYVYKQQYLQPIKEIIEKLLTKYTKSEIIKYIQDFNPSLSLNITSAIAVERQELLKVLKEKPLKVIYSYPTFINGIKFDVWKKDDRTIKLNQIKYASYSLVSIDQNQNNTDFLMISKEENYICELDEEDIKKIKAKIFVKELIK